ncbi:MAG: 50S ribosomal protein L27 [bacterium]|nr:50S ribosomal protein L27 [bacterium]
MAHKKSAGTTKNGRDSNPKYLGIKITPGALAKVGAILVRQRGSDVLAGKNVSMGKDHTLFAIKDGLVALSYKRKVHFDNKIVKKKVVSVLPRA